MLISLITSALLPLIALAAPLTERDIEERSISGVIIDSDFPDPTWYQVGDSYWAFSTTSGGLHVPMAKSSDFNTWTRVSGYDALPTVARRPPANPPTASARVVHDAPGPVHAPRDDAIQCHLDQGGAIDPAGFQDHTGRQFIRVQDRREQHGQRRELQQRRRADPLDAAHAAGGGPEGRILDRGDADGPLIDAPSLLHLPVGECGGRQLLLGELVRYELCDECQWNYGPVCQVECAADGDGTAGCIVLEDWMWNREDIGDVPCRPGYVCGGESGEGRARSRLMWARGLFLLKAMNLSNYTYH
ncbi:hypothetical protein BDZ89DRAFT_1045541 [Hymenopellis radicata]|nr:hypothetical protein BDZ89DRAFT_1045541 [Hymenopellis radicata]